MLANFAIVLFTVTILVFVMFGLIYKPNPDSINIKMNEGKKDVRCFEHLFDCRKDSDCETCIEHGEGIEMVCQSFTEAASAKSKVKKACVSKSSKIDCDFKKGGILVYSGEGASIVPEMQWKCMCAFPNYAGTPNCANINPGVCNGPEVNGSNTFDWSDFEKHKTSPQADDCHCPSNYTQIEKNGKPLCVPKDLGWWYEK